jgi:putative FmdB family regulatory protein
VPTYDYQCRSCGHRIEVIHAMADEGPATCEVCGGELRRILYPAGIIFKGSGFYKTDSRSSSSASVSKGAKADGSGAKTDKPAGSSESTGTASGGDASAGPGSGGATGKDSPSAGSAPPRPAPTTD